MSFVRKEWATRDAILAEVADVPDNWLRGFMIRHPQDCRKFAAARGGKMLFRVEAVLAAIESGEAMPSAGIVNRGEAVDGGASDPQDAGTDGVAVRTVAVPVKDPKGVAA